MLNVQFYWFLCYLAKALWHKTARSFLVSLRLGRGAGHMLTFANGSQWNAKSDWVLAFCLDLILNRQAAFLWHACFKVAWVAKLRRRKLLNARARLVTFVFLVVVPFSNKRRAIICDWTLTQIYVGVSTVNLSSKARFIIMWLIEERNFLVAKKLLSTPLPKKSMKFVFLQSRGRLAYLSRFPCAVPSTALRHSNFPAARIEAQAVSKSRKI